MELSHTLMGKNGNATISKYIYLKVAQGFHWATKEHFILWFTGRTERHRRTETILPRLVRKGKLTSYQYKKRLIYAVPRVNRKRIKGKKYYPKVEHGLGCTEGLVRFWLSRKGEIIPERKFRGFEVVPEWGIKYGDDLILYEFCTEDNFYQSGNVQGKITRYKKHLRGIEQQFRGKVSVVFVIDVDRWTVQNFVDEKIPIGEQFFFSDYDTFLKSPYGEQLIDPIYIWGDNGWPYPLES